MANHWHLLLWPEEDGQLSAFLQRLTNTHTQRWQQAICPKMGSRRF